MMRLLTILVIIGHQVYAQLPVIIHETFDVNRYGWHEIDKPPLRVSIQDGKYVLDVPSDGWMTYLAPQLDPTRDFSIQATFTQLEGNDDNGLGLLWGHDGKAQTNTFTITSSGYYRIGCSDKSMKVPDTWKKSKHINPMGEPNTLNVTQRHGMLHFSVNGELLAATKAFPWPGKFVGFVSFTAMKLQVDDFILSQDLGINLMAQTETTGVRENLGPNINTAYDEVSPKISADGTTLYFGRKLSPENVGGRFDKEDIWESTSDDGINWKRSRNVGRPVNTPTTNNLLSVSTDQNTLLFHVNNGFAFMHRTARGWSSLEDLGIRFENESNFLEGCLSSDGKAILFVAKLRANAWYRKSNSERDIYVCVKKADGTWSQPQHTGNVINSTGDEYSPFLSADGKTLYYASKGKPGYGDVDIFMSRRLSDGWQDWANPVNLGLGINTVGFDAYYTLPASGDYGYMVSNINTIGQADIIRFRQPASTKPGPVVLVSGRVLNSKTQKPLPAVIRFDDLTTGKEVGEARVNPRTGDYDIALPAGKNYGFHAAAPGYLSVNENLELREVTEYREVTKDLYLVPIAIGESIQLKNVFFVQSRAELMPESYPELDRLVQIMKDNPTIEIELAGHTDSRGSPEANLALSGKRVEAVREYLLSKGIASSRITGKGYGGSRPIAPSDTEQNRQLNRRVEFIIVKK